VGAKAKVIGFESRPLLRLTPPPESSDKRVKTFTYIEAVRRLPTNFTSLEVRPILAKIDPQFRGKLRSTFVVLSDDDWSTDRGSRVSKRGREAEADEPADVPDPKTVRT